jgi:hypothetical protein
MMAPRAFASGLESLASRVVLHLVPMLDDTPTGRSILAVCDALLQAGAQPLVACAGGDLIGDLQAKGGRAIALPLASRSPLRMVQNGFALRRLIQDEGVHLIHAWARGPAWSAVLARRKTDIALVTGWAGIPAASGAAAAYGSVLFKGEAILLSSTQQMTAIQKRHTPADLAKRLHLIPRVFSLDGFDPDAIAPARIAALHQAWVLEAHEVPVLLASHGGHDASHALMAQVAEILQKHGASRLRLVAIDKSLDLQAAMLAASALVIAQSGDLDSASLAVCAQAMGLPVIVAGSGEAAEVVLAPPDTPAHQRTGWTTDEADAANVALAFAELLTLRPSQKSDMAARAHQHAQNHFSLAHQAQSIIAIHAELLAKRA